MNECTPCTIDLRSYEIDYDEVSECTESIRDHKKGMTAKGNEISPAKMPLMRIRSVEIVFEDEMSTCTDTGILDRSLELLNSDSSEDSTKCLEDIEPLIAERDCNYDSVTLNAEADFSDDNSHSLSKEDEVPRIEMSLINTNEVDNSINKQTESLTLSLDVVPLSPSISEVGDSGRFTEDASSSRLENISVSYEDARLSRSFDSINMDKAATVVSAIESSDSCNLTATNSSKLYEYIDSNSDSSDDTATCDVDFPIPTLTSLNTLSVDDDQTVCDSSDLQYDSFIDMGKF